MGLFNTDGIESKLSDIDRNIMALLAEIRQTNKLLAAQLFEQQADAAEQAPAATAKPPRLRGVRRNEP